VVVQADTGPFRRVPVQGRSLARVTRMLDACASLVDEVGYEGLTTTLLAERAGVAEPNAMVIGTVDAAGRPVTRTVLCKNVDESGITFYTNYDSAKGADLAAVPYDSATFPWFRLGRQVHVRGPVTKVPHEQTADYWSKRPRGSQLGAWASHQSKPIASRAALLEQLAEVRQQFADRDEVPVPQNWGGYLIAPEVVEFWQGRENRLHNRIRVTEGRIERLQP